MNTADYCAEGREKYKVYMTWKNCQAWESALIRTETATRDAYRKYREHVDDCAICKEE